MSQYPDPELVAALLRGVTIEQHRADKAAQKARACKADSDALQRVTTAPINVDNVAAYISGSDLVQDNGLADRARDANDAAQWRDQPNRNRPSWKGGPSKTAPGGSNAPGPLQTERGPVATKADFAAALDDEATTHAAVS